MNESVNTRGVPYTTESGLVNYMYRSSVLKRESNLNCNFSRWILNKLPNLLHMPNMSDSAMSPNPRKRIPQNSTSWVENTGVGIVNSKVNWP